MTVIHEFISGIFLWRDALIASSIVALLCGWLGVYVVLKRIVFVSAALPQISGLGIAMAFYIGSFLGEHGHAQFFLLNPWVMAIIFSCSAAALFSFNIDLRKLSGETVIGIGYILAGALVLEILNSPRIVQEAHEIGDILFGNAVVVATESLYVILVAAAVVLVIHVALYKEFISVMFDAEMAETLGLNVRFYNLILYLTFAVAVSLATRTIGALPVFGFMVVPPTASLMIAKSLKGTIFLSIVIGVSSALVGYFISYVLGLPTGATMVALASVWLIPGLVFLKLRPN